MSGFAWRFHLLNVCRLSYTRLPAQMFFVRNFLFFFSPLVQLYRTDVFSCTVVYIKWNANIRRISPMNTYIHKFIYAMIVPISRALVISFNFLLIINGSLLYFVPNILTLYTCIVYVNEQIYKNGNLKHLQQTVLSSRNICAYTHVFRIIYLSKLAPIYVFW